MTTRSQTALRAIAVLLSLVVAEMAMVGWLLLRPRSGAPSSPAEVVKEDGHLAEIDYAHLFPDWKPEDREALRNESESVRLVYEPFVQFRPLAMKKRFVEITADAYRASDVAQPWPPNADDLVVFVFGGVNTLGVGLPNEQTVVAFLQQQFRARHPELRAQFYNFGSGSYFSSQERVRFETLLVRGFVPDAALFLDGAGDFDRADGRPLMTATLFHVLAPDVPLPPSPLDHSGNSTLVEAVIDRLQQNQRMSRALAQKFGVRTIFIGEPPPPPGSGHELAEVGYPRFEQAAADGVFGPSFVWCGDAFQDDPGSNWAAGALYSPKGAERLAAVILERVLARGLLEKGAGPAAGGPESS